MAAADTGPRSGSGPLALGGPGAAGDGARVATSSSASRAIHRRVPAGPATVSLPIAWTTLAGRPTGNEDGPAERARFSLGDSGIAVAADGTVYVADTNNYVIRAVAPDGSAATLAGTGQGGWTDGPGSAAAFSWPAGVAVAADGSVLVVERFGNRVRRIAPDGMVSTVAGSWEEAFADGAGEDARFGQPVACALDAAGVLYVAELGNRRIRRVTPDGVVSTLAGSGVAGYADGPGDVAQFESPVGIAVDAAGVVYVADGHRIRTVAPDGTVATLAGSGTPGWTDGQGTAAQFAGPRGLAVDAAGDLLVADQWNHRIRRVTADGQVTTLAGSGEGGWTDGPAATARFSGPGAVAADADGTVYVADSGNNVVRTIQPDGTVATLSGSGPAPSGGWADGTGAEALFSGPSGVAADAAGTAFVADTWNNVIRVVTPVGAVTTLAGRGWPPGFADGPPREAAFWSPAGVAIDAAGTVYVADQDNNRIRAIAPDGTVSTLAGGGDAGYRDGTGAGALLSGPTGVAVDAAGDLVVADRGNHRIRRVTRAGAVTTLAGDGTAGFADGPAAAARFNWPWGVAVDTRGAVWVADEGNNRVRRLDRGHVSTVAGGGGGGDTDGPGATARFAGPRGIVVDRAGFAWVADYWNNRIRRIAPDGTVTTVGGGESPGGSDGVGAFARFRNPSGIAFGPGGTLVVADHWSNAVRVGRAAALDEAATIDAAEAPVEQERQLGTTGGGATAWAWQVTRRPPGSAAPLPSPAERAPTFTPDAPGLYTFRLTASDGAAESTTETSLLAYHPAAAAVSGDVTVCAGMAATVTAALRGTPPWTVTWSDGVTQEGIAASPAVRTVTSAATTVYTVTAVSDPHGPGTATGSATVTVSGVAPSATITAPYAVAPGRGGYLASVPDAGPGASYAWTIANGAITAGTGTREVAFSVTGFETTRLAVTVAAGPCSLAGAFAIRPAAPREVSITLPGDVPLALVRVPAGTFSMGSPDGEDGREADEGPQHAVTLADDLYIGKAPVTQGQWQAVMGTPMPAECGDHGVGTDVPVYCVSWDDVAGPGGFLERLNAHLRATNQPGAGKTGLPSEAEWERAARGGAQTRFSFGDAPGCDDACGPCEAARRAALWCGNGGGAAQPVGGRQANPYGLLDVHGNVREWVQDRYGTYAAAPATNPTGPTSGSTRVVRGGAASGPLAGARSAARTALDPASRSATVGFRVAGAQAPGTDIRDWATADLEPFLSVAGRWRLPRDVGVVGPYWSAVKLGAEQREGIALAGWKYSGFGGGEETFRTVPVSLFEQRADGAMTEATERLLGDPTINGAGSVIAHDFNGDGREDLLFPAHNESPFILKPSTAWVTRPDGSFEKVALADNVMNHDARLVSLGGTKQVVSSSFGLGPIESTNYLYRWAAGGFVIDGSLGTLGGMSVAAGAFGDAGEEWVVVGDAWWGPWAGPCCPMETFAYRLLNGGVQLPPTRLPRPYFDGKPEYASYHSGWDPASKSHVSRLWVTDLNQDGRLDILAGTEIWDQEDGLQQSVFQALVNRGGDGSSFTDETDALAWEYRKDTAAIDYSARLADLDGSGIDSMILGGHKLWLGAGARPLGDYILVNDGTGKMYAALHDEFWAFAPRLIRYVQDRLPQGEVAADWFVPGFIPYVTSRGAINLLSLVFTCSESDFTSDGDAMVSLALNIDLATDFRRDLEVGPRNGSRNIRTFAGDDTIHRALADPDCAVDGGLGVDTVVYPGPRAAWVIERTAEKVTIRPAAGGGGTDTLTRVERARFDDTTVGLDAL